MSTLTLDPELRGVLEDVVKQSPDSSIFTDFTPTRFQKTFTLPDQTISIARAGLSTAERELVSVHREKLAWVLREAFFVNFYADGGSLWMTPPDDLVERASLAVRAERVRDTARSAAYRYRSGHYLRRVAAGAVVRGAADLSSLLIASLRLVDHSKTRLGHAILDIKRGDLPAVWRCVTPFLDRGDIRNAIAAERLLVKGLREGGEYDKADDRAMALFELILESGDEADARDVIGETVLLRLRRSAASWGAASRGVHISDVKQDVLRIASEDWACRVIPELDRRRILELCLS